MSLDERQRLIQLLRLLNAAGMNVRVDQEDSEQEVEEEQEETYIKQPVTQGLPFDPLKFYHNLSNFKNKPLSTSFGVYRKSTTLS